MLAVIRISGQVGLRAPVKETLTRLRLTKKYTCVVFEKPTKVEEGMVNAVKDFVAFGEIDAKTYKKIVDARGQKGTKFFRLHPPRKGIDSKKHFGVNKGVLGNNKTEINKLIERML